MIIAKVYYGPTEALTAIFKHLTVKMTFVNYFLMLICNSDFIVYIFM